MDELNILRQKVLDLERDHRLFKEIENKLQSANQQLQASEQQLKATNQQLIANEQQLRAANQQLEASEQGLINANKKLQLANEEIKRSEKYLENIIENIADPIFVKDEDSKLLVVNDAFCQLFGLKKENIIGKDLVEDVSPAERDSFLRIDKMVLNDGKENINEESLTVRGGLDRTIATKKSRFIDDKGRKFLVGVIRDITERKQTEKNILKNQYYLSKAQEMGKIGTWEIDIIENQLVWTDESYNILGVPIGTPMTYDMFLNQIHPEDRDYVNSEWSIALTSKQYDIEHRLLIGDQVKWVREKADIEFDDNGNAIKAIGFIQDTTAKKNIERELIAAKEKAEESEEKYKALYDNAPLSYQSLNEDGSFRDVNPTWLSTLGYEREEVIGKFYKDFLHPTWQSHFEQNFPAFKKRGYVSDVQFKIRHKKGHYLDISFEGCIGYNSDGSFKQTYCVFKDITAQKLAENELIKAKEKAEENERKLIEAQKLSHIGNWEYIIDTDTVTWSKELYTIFERPLDLPAPSYALQQSFYTEESYALLDKAVQDCIQHEIPYEIELDIIVSSGAIKQIISKGKVIKDQNNKIIGSYGTAQDITAKKRIERELIAAKEKAEESEFQFKQLFESEADAIFIAAVENGIILDLNRAGEKLMQMPKDEIIGLHQSKLHPQVPDDYSTRIFNEQKQAIDKLGGAVLVENKIVRKDGVQVPVEILASKVRYKGNECLIGTFRDITERKKAEETLRKSEEMVISSQSVAHICSYSTILNENDLEKSTWVCSPEFYKIFGIDETYPHTIAGWVGFIHPDHRDKLAAYHEYVVKNKTSFNHQYKIIRINDGVERWVEGTGELEFDTQGNPIRMYGAIQDITERKKAENELLEKEVQYHNLANSGTALIWASGLDKLCFYFNDPWLNFTGRTLEQEYGNGWTEGVHPDDFDHCLNIYVTSFDKKVPFEMEYRMKRADGEYRWILDLGTPNYNSVGEFVGYIGHCFDITDRKKVQKDLIKAKEKAEESDRIKTAFLQNMSHEIRTPMNSIMGFASLLPEEEDKNSINNYSEIIYNNAEQLVHVIDDIIMYSQLQNKQFTFMPKEFEANNLINDIKQSFNLPEYQKGVELKTEILAGDSIAIFSDYDKIRQIFTNLISNAFKYTPKGSITFGINTIDKEHIFFVKDTGIGIPKLETDRIFERFHRASNVNKSVISGTGLGLSIVKELVELLGGKIWVESEVGKGSTFYFTMPTPTGMKY
ncbi:MAG: PAS domain S-box protein [Prolixibacteraceae bacterium]